MSATKTCPRCQQSKPHSQFGWRDAEHSRRQSYCKPCMRETWREWYSVEPNRHHHLDLVSRRRRKRIERHRQLVQELKSQPCADCGRRYPGNVMDFDHIGTKHGEVSSIMHYLGTEKLLKEISACEVVCANSHRERTYRRMAMSGKDS